MTVRQFRQSRSRSALDAAVLLVALAVAGGALAVLVPAGVDASQAPTGDLNASSPTAGLDAGSTTADAAAPSTGDAADAALAVSDAAVAPGEQTTVAVTLSEVPDGLAGFEVTLELASPGVATVANASYPEQYGYATTPRVTDDGQSVTLEAVDLHDEVQPGDEDVRLATVVVRGEDGGETAVAATELQVDADGGAAVDPALEPGAVSVSEGAGGSAGAAAAASAGDGVDAGDDSDATAEAGANGLESWTLGALVAVVLGSLLAVVITRDR